MEFNYQKYWERTYASGGNSGPGSSGAVCEFKAAFMNRVIARYVPNEVIDFGCGDGNQLVAINYPRYLGLDVAPSAIRRCAERFREDCTKSFMLYLPRHFINKDYLQADLVVCLDVLYHVIDDGDFEKTLEDINSCARKAVILFTTIGEEPAASPSVRHRSMEAPLQHHLARFQRVDCGQATVVGSSAEFIVLER